MAATSEHTLDARDFIAGMRRLESQVQEEARRLLGQATGLAEQFVQQTDAFKDRTGALRGSLATTAQDTFSRRVQVGGPKAPYAVFIEEGSRAHTIAARRAKMLRFVQDGQVRFAKQVWHPGTKPKRFMASIAHDVGSAIDGLAAGIVWR